VDEEEEMEDLEVEDLHKQQVREEPEILHQLLQLKVLLVVRALMLPLI
jgi:hypothetical protein